MENEKAKLVGKGAIVFDLLLTILFFVYMTSVCISHVQSDTVRMQYIIGAYGASCVAGVFWLALQLLRVTCVDQMRKKKVK